MPRREPILAVPVHLIMGFLGVGKTTAIKQLLAHKPQDERWAVLVNEFGEIGVDGAMLSNGGDRDIAVEQIPGGCMCCAAGPITQVALNKLLRRERPDRLLIEPSGLGHPADILRLLRAPEYQQVLQVRDVITLLDPRHVTQSRYQQHRLFKDQVQVAERIVLNKIDLCDAETVAAAWAWLNTRVATDIPRHAVSRGAVSMSWLNLEPGVPVESAHTSPVAAPVLDWRSAPQAPVLGHWVQVDHAADGYYSLGWRVAPSECWQADELLTELMSIDALRIKGILSTDRGWLVFNLAEGSLSASDIPAQTEGVIEIIHDAPIAIADVKQAFLNCQVAMV